LGAHQGADRLLGARPGPALGAAGGLEGGGGGLGAGGGLAQGRGVAGAAGDLAPDDGGVQPALRAVAGADAAGGDVGGAAFLAQQGEVEQLEQGGVAAGQPVADRLQPLGRKLAEDLATQLEHGPPPAPAPSRDGTSPARLEGSQQSRSRAP